MSNRAPKMAKPKRAERETGRGRGGTGLWSKGAKLVSAAVAMIGLIAALLTFLPRVTATVSDPVDPNDPFSSSVTITNTGYLPLDSVTAAWALGEIKFLNPGGRPITDIGDEANEVVRRDTWASHDLGPDDRFTISLNEAFRGNRTTLVSAEIAIVVVYELPLPLIHIRRAKRFPILAKRASNGNFYWYGDTLHKGTN